MTDLALMLPLVLARERADADRLVALTDLAGLAADPAAVAVLLDLAADEPSLVVRGAMLRAVAAVDITRLPDRAAHAAAWAGIAARETAVELRSLAVTRLADAGLAGEAGVAELLAALIGAELDGGVRSAALSALIGVARLSEAAAGELASYAARSTTAEAGQLLQLAPRLPDAAGQRLWAALLVPTRPPAVRAAAAEALRGCTSLRAEAMAALVAQLELQPDETGLRWAIAALEGVSTLPAGLLASILSLATALPSRAGILQALRERLDASPDLATRIEDAVLASDSSALWQEAIALLSPGGRDRVALAGLASPAAATRSAALAWAESAPPARAEAVVAAVAQQLPCEALAGLRLRQAAILAAAKVVPAEAAERLVAHLAVETIPEIRRDLAWALFRCQIGSGPARSGLLAQYSALLTDPTTPTDLAHAISLHLQRVATENGDASCVPALLTALAQAGSLDEVERLDRIVRTLEPDLNRHATLTYGLMRRHHHMFPQDPLTQWARDIRDGAKAGALPPSAVLETVRLTGASWLLEGGAFAEDKELLLSTIRSAILADRSLDAERAIREAYEQKSIRKRDLAEIVRLVAFRPRWHHLADRAIRICVAEKVITPALIDAAWPILLGDPASDLAYSIAQHFAEHAADPHLSARTRASCIPSEHRPFLLADANPDYTGKSWPIFTILIAAGADAVAQVFTGIAPDAGFHGGLITALRSRQRKGMAYWEHHQVMLAAATMWRSIAGEPALAGLHRELGRMLTGNKPARPRQHTGGEERSRIWNDYVAKAGLQALAAPMPEIGAELWIDFCLQLSPGPGQPPAKLPAVPSGVSLEHLRAKWPFATGM